VEVAAFEKVCADREQQSAVLGTAVPAATHAADSHVDANRVTYAPCPQCGQLMNRLNFARCSGVIVDICKQHGTWFDRDELRQIVEFLRAGGMDVARQKEKVEIEAQREQLRQEQMAAAQRSELRSMFYSDDERLHGINATRGILKFLLQ
jgi:Zn-finger nucleic acid-binding protein